MKKDMKTYMEKTGLSDPVYGCILIAAGVVCLYGSFFLYAQALYEQFLAVPCILALGILLGRKTELKNKSILLLPAAMMAWFFLLWLKQGLEAERVYDIGLFITIYLFAFPLATLLQDGEKKTALKMFAAAYFAAAAALTASAVLLLLDCVPESLSWIIYWDGARLQAFWHPNMTACFLMIGVVFGTTFLSRSKSLWAKAGIFVLIVMMLGAMALTNCRTAIIMTGGYLGATIFFWLIKHSKKWFIPSVLVAAVVTVLFFTGAGRLYEGNHERLAEKKAQPQTVQTMDVSVDKDTEIEIVDDKVPKAADKAKVTLETNSPQGTFEKDLGSLNGRTKIWKAAVEAIREDRSILLWGVERPGQRVSPYNSFKITHLHNAWMETLVGMGFVGLLIAVIFTVFTAWNCLMILLKHHRDIWKRNVALLALLLMAASILEPYLFYTITDYHPYNLVFFLCAGYLAHWQEEDNRKIVNAICRKQPFGQA